MNGSHPNAKLSYNCSNVKAICQNLNVFTKNEGVK